MWLFCQHLTIYILRVFFIYSIHTTNALDAMADEDGDQAETPVIPTVTALLKVSSRAQHILADISNAEMDFATSIFMGERLIEI